MRRQSGTVMALLLAAAGLVGLPPSGAKATAAEATAAPEAAQLIAATRRAVVPFQDPKVAERAGYVPASVSGPIEHWVDQRLVTDGVRLDPQHPAGLVYVDTGHGLRLVAAMFILDRVGQAEPAVPGATWHHHTWCQGTGGIGIPLPGGPCPPGTSLQVGPEMLHVWLADVALDPFAADMTPAVVCRLATSPAASLD
jgi:hypothetical protein